MDIDPTRFPAVEGAGSDEFDNVPVWNGGRARDAVFALDEIVEGHRATSKREIESRPTYRR